MVERKLQILMQKCLFLSPKTNTSRQFERRTDFSTNHALLYTIDFIYHSLSCSVPSVGKMPKTHYFLAKSGSLSYFGLICDKFTTLIFLPRPPPLFAAAWVLELRSASTRLFIRKADSLPPILLERQPPPPLNASAMLSLQPGWRQARFALWLQRAVHALLYTRKAFPF